MAFRSLLLFVSLSFCFPLRADLHTSKECGKKLAESLLKGTENLQEHFSLEKHFDDAKTLDPDEAEKSIKAYRKNEQPVKSDAVDFLLSEEVKGNRFDNSIEIDLLAENANAIIERNSNIQDKTEEAGKTIETCLKEGDPFFLNLQRKLDVQVEYSPEETKEVRCCKGDHKIKERKRSESSAKSWAEDKKKELLRNPEIKSCWFKNPKHLGPLNWEITVYFTHHDDAKSCKSYHKKTEVVKEGIWNELGQDWIYLDGKEKDFAFSTQCTHVQTDCFDTDPKTIHGKEVQKKCWHENLLFVCEHPPQKKCDFLSHKNCRFLSKKCLSPSDFGCSLWEVTYECWGLTKNSWQNNDDLFGSDSEEWDTDYESDTSFSEVASTLAIFDEIQHEYSRSEEIDPDRIQIFKGIKRKCEKSVIDDVFFDCCFKKSGLATDIGLAKCNADELKLAEMNEMGLCHYVGTYKEEILDLLKKSDVHVFCCFSSKIARVFQESAREQLGIGWGSPKEPQCRGLTKDEVARVDFSKIDLRDLAEAFPRKTPEDFEKKVESLKEKIQKKIEESKRC